MGSQDCAQATSGLRELAFSLAGFTQWQAAQHEHWTWPRHTPLIETGFFGTLRRIGCWTTGLIKQMLAGAFTGHSSSYNGTQFRRRARSLRSNCLYFPTLSEMPYQTRTPPSAHSCTCELKHWRLTLVDNNTPSSSRGPLLYSNSPGASSVDFLTNTCGRGVEGEVLSVGVLSCVRALTRCVGNRGKCLMWQLLASWIFTNHSLLITLMSVWCS